MRFGFRELVLMLILLAVPLSSYWLVFRPVNAEIELAKAEADLKRDRLSKLREETSRNADLEKENKDIAASIEAFEAKLPSKKELDAIIRQVSELATQQGLTSPTVKSLKAVKAAMYMEQPLELALQGNFRSFHDFVHKLEQLPRITKIPDFKLKRATDKNGDMQATFTLSIYYVDEGAKSQ
ncbi:MAG: type 4a pilus biogenesis protein PilO [Phycisphaeraceae bacterium]|nr:type 4a pilus biogenesis protein PilO [Phycisphaeraceae bacterium]